MTQIPAPVLIIGARSDIGRALARAYAGAGCPLILAARDCADLANDVADLEVRYGAHAVIAECDVTAPDPDAFFAGLPQVPGTIIMLAGLLGDQARSAADTAEARTVMETNFTGPALLLLAAARRLEARGDCCIIGVSSVAGERGRASNFIYGSAKAGLTALLSGLRNSLASRGVAVITVKPGFVATRMTEGMKLPPALTAQPDAVATAILNAQRRGADIVYVKPIWWLIMLVIRSIPERIFKRLSL
jgi:NAD(P)-dependent dehydrogenase (short-subunit alcohol dehydrogenase family)